MAMEISSNYSSYYGNGYMDAAGSKKKTSGDRVEEGSTGRTAETGSAARKKAADELSYLSEKYRDCTFVAVNYKKGMQYGSMATTNIAISPEFLKKMADNPELEKEYESYFEGMQRLDAENIRAHAAEGRRMVAQGWAIDKDGGISRWGISEPTDKRHYGQEMTDYANKIREKRLEEKCEKTKLEAKADTGRKDSLLRRLQKKYSGFDITAGAFSRNQISSRSRGFQGVMISPAYLAKAENSEKTAKELDEMLSGVESAQKWMESAFRRDGLELVSCGYFINENGEMGSWSLVKKKDSMFDNLEEQGKKSADRLKEKQERAQEQKKEEEKKAEKREAEEQQEKQIKSSGKRLLVVASSKEELLEKARAAANGVNEKGLAKEERASGSRFDYSI